VKIGNSTRCCKLYQLLPNTFATVRRWRMGRPGKRE